jgi:hypothetical protein
LQLAYSALASFRMGMLGFGVGVFPEVGESRLAVFFGQVSLYPDARQKDAAAATAVGCNPRI